MAHKRFRLLRRLLLAALYTTGTILLIAILFSLATRVEPPASDPDACDSLKVTVHPSGLRSIGNNWLRHSSSGLWEMYIEGEPYQRGVINGKLTEHLLLAQEVAFTDQIRKMIPYPVYLNFLKYFIYWFNRNLDDHIPVEYQREIDGVSKSASDRFNYIGTPYKRMLNYHSAHDIGHALSDLALVGCTSFAAWDGETADSTLLLGRNFDFYAGDAFAEHKIVLFERPDAGYPFMMITWAGMVGTVSGMNMQGLTVTINAARSKIPHSARTPISILAREILQYASTIEEAYAIAKKRETFVSESLLIGSARDGKAAIIEKSPYEIALVQPGSDLITCANHFQSQKFADDPMNRSNIRESASLYRQRRLLQTLSVRPPFDPVAFSAILRDQSGLNGTEIGMGNEKAINQLIAHHSVVFQPERLLVWVSTAPWQLGTYVCYDLTKIFNTFATSVPTGELTEASLAIAGDPFLLSPDYAQFLRFRTLSNQLRSWHKKAGNQDIPEALIEQLKRSNPDYFESYSLSGDIYFRSGEWLKAAGNYQMALQKEVPTWSEKLRIIGNLAECNVNLKNKRK